MADMEAKLQRKIEMENKNYSKYSITIGVRAIRMCLVVTNCN